MRILLLLLAALLGSAGASRPGRLLTVAGNPTPYTDPRYASAADVSGAVPRYTVPGTDVLVVDTTSNMAGGGAGSGVLTNQVEANARAGSTYDAYGTVARTRAVGAADAEMRTALGGIDQQSYIQQAAAARESAFVATRLAQGSAAVTARGDGKDIRANENRASLASMDASSAVQMVTRGMSANAGHAARVGTASATAVTTPSNHWFVYMPTWW